MQSDPVKDFSEWIEKVLDDPSSAERLPTIHQLSRQFGISPSSVRRVLKPYIADNRLVTIRRRGTFIRARAGHAYTPAGQPAATSARSVADAVTDDIAAGRLKHGDPLPPLKVVCSQFKTAHRNVTRAYRLLEQKGLVRKVGRSYWVGGMKSIRGYGRRKSIPCFNFSEGDPSDMSLNNEIGNAYERLEAELNHHGLNLRFEAPERVDLFLRPDAFAKSDCAGVIISGLVEDRFRALLPLVKALGPTPARRGKPILLCGAIPQRNVTLPRVSRGIHYFCHGTIITNIVRASAEYSFTHGFRDIVLLFQETENNLFDIRFYLRFISESLARNPGTRIRFLIQPLYGDRSPEQVFKRTPSYRGLKSFIYHEVLLSKYSPFTMDDLYKMITLGDTMDDLLSHAPRGSLLLSRDISTALTAARWCAAHRIPLPSGAAVLCLDDDPSLRRHGIASCVPDWNTIGYLMAHALIGDIPIQTSRHGFLRTPALLLQRGSLP